VTRLLGKALGLCLMLLFCQMALGATPIVYRIRKVQGVVLTRTPTSARWLAVREGTIILEDQIIQVTKDASVTIEEHTSRKAAGMDKDRFQITLMKPIVTRLTRDLLRQVHLSTFFVERPAIPTAPAGKEVKDVAASLNEAWERLVAMVTSIPPAEAPPPDLRDLERQGMALAVSAKKIHIVSPSMNTVVQSSDWPTELKVIWTKPKPAPSMRYFIYAWSAGTQRGSPVGETREDFHTIKLQRAGTYFVQVISVDGAWQSTAQAIHAVAPLGQSMPRSAQEPVVQKISESLLLRYPPDGFVLASQASPTAMTLHWEAPATWKTPDFEIKVADDSGNVVQLLRSQTKEVTLDLRPGRFVWSVTLLGSNIRSVQRRFEIVSPELSTTRDMRRQLVRTLITSGEDVTISLDTGI
jgi:hypothetical protein